MTTTKVAIQILDDRLRGLLCGALEGGSNYWYTVVECRFSPGNSYADFQEGGKHTLDKYWHPYELIPFVEGCGLIIGDVEAEENTEPAFEAKLLDREAIEKGIKIMAEKYPHCFADVLAENDDAGTADCFLQCCILGEIQFG